MIITIITTITTTKKSVLVWPLPCRKYSPPIGAEFLIGIVLQLVIQALNGQVDWQQYLLEVIDLFQLLYIFSQLPLLEFFVVWPHPVIELTWKEDSETLSSFSGFVWKLANANIYDKTVNVTLLNKIWKWGGIKVLLCSSIGWLAKIFQRAFCNCTRSLGLHFIWKSHLASADTLWWVSTISQKRRKIDKAF